jgi:hypothetical protein
MASNIQNTGTLTSTPSTGGTRSNVVRVFDIVLDADHAIFRDSGIPYDPTLLGMIFYGDKDLDVTSTSTFSLPKALPKVRGKYPVINELVKIETGPSPDIYTDIGGNNSFNYVYYGEVVPVHGNAVHNALPSQKDLASTTPTSEESVLASNGTPNQSQPNEVSLDNTGNYQPKDDVRNLQPFAGDVIMEGRAGQTIRMGTTNKEGTNNWSDGDTFGDPVMILRVGQSENQQGSTVVEDVNGDASSIYMFANQKLNNIQLTTTNFESCQATYTEATVPTVQLAVAPPPPEQTIPEEPTTPVDINDPTLAVEPTQPQVTSSFSDDELEDPVFAALAEAEEEGLIEISTENWILSDGGPTEEEDAEENQNSTESFEARLKEAKNKSDKGFDSVFPGTNRDVKAKKFYSAHPDQTENFVSEPLPVTEAITKIVKARYNPASNGILAIVLHFTGGHPNTTISTAEGITKQHLWTEDKGENRPNTPWTRQGYHYVVGTDGKVCALVPESKRSRGISNGPDQDRTKTQFTNSNTININFSGGYPNGVVDFKKYPNQFKAFGLLLEALINKYPNAKVIGHNQVKDKSCPGFWVPRLLERFGNLSSKIVDTGYNDYNTQKWINKADELYETIKDAFN